MLKRPHENLVASFMITIKHSQKTIPFSVPIYRKKAEIILQYLGYADFDLGIQLTTNRVIQKYNSQFKQQNQPTDVLSFPYHTDLKAGQKIIVTSDEDKNLGDIVISLPYVLANAKGLKGNFEQRMDRMLVHGIVHLLGYDHIHDEDYKKMSLLENKLLKLIISL